MAFTYATMALESMDMPMDPEEWKRIMRMVFG